MSLYMETTKIPIEKTAQEIATLLAQAGATAVLTEYDKDRKIKALCFKLEVKGSQVPFMLPARVTPVFQYFQKKTAPRNRDRMQKAHMEQAERVAWRQLYRWIEAQLAMIDTGMVEAAEVFYPYIQVGPNQTMYQRALETGKLLTAGGE